MGCGVLPGVSEPDSPIHRFIAYLGAADVVILILPLVYAPCLRRRRRQPTQHLSSTSLRACVDAPECQALSSLGNGSRCGASSAMKASKVRRSKAPLFIADIRLIRPSWRRSKRSEEHTSELQSLMRPSYAVL